ncbi:hypothetical protein [Kitasatospora phosalacinea]|uniref:Uncharacterized protein n=1 Tax=Kitasatospora phosalacinea TaxID=2065 RepID=A0ABW6GUM6_9ACTN
MPSVLDEPHHGALAPAPDPVAEVLGAVETVQSTISGSSSCATPTRQPGTTLPAPVSRWSGVTCAR